VLEWLSRKILLLPLLLLHSLEPHLRFSCAILSSSRFYRVSPSYRPIVRILLLHSCCGIVPEVVLLVEQRIWLIKLNLTFWAHASSHIARKNWTSTVLVTATCCPWNIPMCLWNMHHQHSKHHFELFRPVSWICCMGDRMPWVSSC
jgi:hypothetical protein